MGRDKKRRRSISSSSESSARTERQKRRDDEKDHDYKLQADKRQKPKKQDNQLDRIRQKDKKKRKGEKKNENDNKSKSVEKLSKDAVVEKEVRKSKRKSSSAIVTNDEPVVEKKIETRSKTKKRDDNDESTTKPSGSGKSDLSAAERLLRQKLDELSVRQELQRDARHEHEERLKQLREKKPTAAQTPDQAVRSLEASGVLDRFREDTQPKRSFKRPVGATKRLKAAEAAAAGSAESGKKPFIDDSPLSRLLPPTNSRIRPTPPKQQQQQSSSTRRNVFVRWPIADRFDVPMLREAFAAYGDVDMVDITQTRREAYIAFAESGGAQRSIQELNGAMLHGCTLTVCWARQQQWQPHGRQALPQQPKQQQQQQAIRLPKIDAAPAPLRPADDSILDQLQKSRPIISYEPDF